MKALGMRYYNTSRKGEREDAKMAADPRLGVTATMSNDPPSQQDLTLDAALLEELKSRNEFEAPEETRRR